MRADHRPLPVKAGICIHLPAILAVGAVARYGPIPTPVVGLGLRSWRSAVLAVGGSGGRRFWRSAVLAVAGSGGRWFWRSLVLAVGTAIAACVIATGS
jgi:hypothetical protein